MTEVDTPIFDANDNSLTDAGRKLVRSYSRQFALEVIAEAHIIAENTTPNKDHVIKAWKRVKKRSSRSNLHHLATFFVFLGGAFFSVSLQHIADKAQTPDELQIYLILLGFVGLILVGIGIHLDR